MHSNFGGHAILKNNTDIVLLKNYDHSIHGVKLAIIVVFEIN